MSASPPPLPGASPPPEGEQYRWEEDLPVAPRRRKGLWILLGILGFLFVSTVGAAVWFASSILQELEVQTRAAAAENEVIRARIGEIVVFDIEWMASGEYDDEDVLQIMIAGKEARGTLTGRFLTVDDSREFLSSGILEIDGGGEYEVVPETPFEP